jgi:hypothetical protein
MEVTASDEKRGLLRNILNFAYLLRSEGMWISMAQLLTALKGVAYTGVGNRNDFYRALHCAMVSNSHEMEIFDRCFKIFWERLDEGSEEFSALMRMRTRSSGEQDGLDDGGEEVGRLLEDAGVDMEKERGQDRQTVEYSPVEILSDKDFEILMDHEVVQVERAIDELARKLSTRLSRRRRRSTSGDMVDLRRSFRRIVKQGGEPLHLIMSARKLKKIKIVLLCDVSGSMDSYSRFFTRFMYAMQNRRFTVETFVFSTRLTRITSLLLNRSIDEAFARMGREVRDWSGGTDIGGCLRTFNTTYAPAIVDSRTLLIIVSDGWDRGDADLLGREMRRLRRSAYRTIWLNPLCGLPDYEPLCKGMQAAMPYIHHLMPAHNLASLEELARKLPQLCP